MYCRHCGARIATDPQRCLPAGAPAYCEPATLWALADRRAAAAAHDLAGRDPIRAAHLARRARSLAARPADRAATRTYRA